MEARGEPVNTQIAVAAVTMNRAKSKEHKGSVCSAVTQRGQFTWNKKAKIKDKKTYESIKKLARNYLNGSIKNPIGKRMYFNHRSLGKRHKTPYSKVRLHNLVFY